MWPFFSKSWLGRLGHRGPAVAEAARNQNSEWRTWLADALTKLGEGDPCQPEAAGRGQEPDSPARRRKSIVVAV